MRLHMRQEFCTVIGVTEDNTLVMLDETFRYNDYKMDGKRVLKGATGSLFAPIYQDYIDYMNDPDVIWNLYEDASGLFEPEEPSKWDFEISDCELEDFIFDEAAFTEALEEYKISYARFERDKARFIRERQDESEHYPTYDGSYVQYIDEDLIQRVFPGAVTVECIGCGRMFPKASMNLKEVFRPDLVLEILNAEHFCRIYEVEG